MATLLDPSDLPRKIRDVIANNLLDERPSRLADYKAEVVATREVIRALVDTPSVVLSRLSNAIMELTGSDSAGVSLSGREAGRQVFLWQAAVGLFEKYLGAVVPHDESPCGSVLDTDTTLLMIDPGRAYLTAAQVQPPIRELLLVPFHVEGRTVGTVWAISQGLKTFDAEDGRIIANISELAALAYQVLEKMGDLELLSQTVQVIADNQFMQRSPA